MIRAIELTRPTWQCIHFVEAATIETISGDLKKTAVVLVHASLKDIESEKRVLAVISAAMQFPDYFGGNWDAFDECLRDMAWLPSVGYVLIIHGSRQVWQTIPQIAGKLIESWLLAAEEWAKQEVAFHLVFAFE